MATFVLLNLLIMRNFYISLLLVLASVTFPLQAQGFKVPGAVPGAYFGEQVLSFTYAPDIRVTVNAPAVARFDAAKPTEIVLFGLPNGNTTDWTIGKRPAAGDDWHFDIQHIGAQTRYVRSLDAPMNLVTVYLEAPQLSWGAWRKTTPAADSIIRALAENLLALFAPVHPYIALNGHSGGGNIPFAFIDASRQIPDYVQRISFIDSDYNWDAARYGGKLVKWLKASRSHCLSVICYNDSVALLDGKHFVSATGGTWYRSKSMLAYLKHKLRLDWTSSSEGDLTTVSADNRRIQFIFRDNPQQAVLHTVLVAKNGFIQSLLSGTALEGRGYDFYGEPAYSTFVSSLPAITHVLKIPPRRADALTGSAFIAKVKNMSLTDREAAIYAELSAGNIPDSLRLPATVTTSQPDAAGVVHSVTFQTLPDVLAIGCDSDFVRMPMLPVTAQRLANLFGATLPTRRLSLLIHHNSLVKLTPHPMTPDATMTTVPVFAAHNAIIESERKLLGKPLSSLIAGHKKDIVITNRLTEVPEKLFIYGWHYPDDTPIQPLSGAHSINYVDYSHGVRLVNDEVLVDGAVKSIKSLLRDATLYKIFSDEQGAMTKVEYTVPSEPGGVEDVPAGATSFSCYPNPATTDTTFSFSLLSSSPVGISILALNGTAVRHLDLGTLPVGSHLATFSTDGLSAGIYLCRLSTSRSTVSSKLIVL